MRPAITVLGILAMAAGPGFTRVKDADVGEWWTSTEARVVAGDAAYYRAGLLGRVAENRGLDLSRYRDGVALMRAGDLGRAVWILWPDADSPWGGTWAGPYLVVDCSRRDHYVRNRERGRVVDVSRAEWLAQGMPEWPVPVVVSFVEPWVAVATPR